MSATTLTSSYSTLTDTHAILFAYEGDVEISTDENPVAGDGFILKQGNYIEVNATQISARAVRGSAKLTSSAVLDGTNASTEETPAEEPPADGD